MALVYIGIISFILVIVIALAFKLFDKPRLAPEPFDRINIEPRKLSRSQLASQEQGQSVTYGTCTQTKQPVWQPQHIRQMNTLFIGPNGIGKTSHIVATALKQDIQREDNAVVIFEGKSDKKLIGLIQRLCQDANRELVIFPFDGGYNPLNIGNTPQARASMFASMIQLAREGVSADAEHFTDEMVKFVNIFVPLFEYVHHIPMIPEELKQLCTSQQLRVDLLEKAKPSREYTRYLTTFGTYRSDDFNNKLSGLVSFIDGMYSAQGATGRATLYNRRSAKGISEAIDRKAVIIIAEGGNRGTDEHDLGMLYFAELMSYVRSRQTKHLVCLYMDELHYYLSRSFTQFQATSRGANVAQILGFQTFAMLEDVSREAAESIKTNCRTWIVHTDLNYADAVTVSQKIGERPHMVFSESRNANATLEKGTQGTHLEDKYLVQPYQIQNMDAKYVLYLSVKEDRSKAPHRYLVKPPILDDSECWYTSPQYSSDIPLTIWEEEAEKRGKRQSRLPRSYRTLQKEMKCSSPSTRTGITSSITKKPITEKISRDSRKSSQSRYM